MAINVIAGYYHELWRPETIKLLGSTKRKITEDKNDENVFRLENTEVVFIHCNIVTNDYQQDSRVLYTYALHKSFGQLQEISLKNVIYSKNLLTQNFHIYKYRLLIKILNHLK